MKGVVRWEGAKYDVKIEDGGGGGGGGIPED